MRHLLKPLIVMAIVFGSGLASATQTALTERICATISSEALAKDVITLIENGIDEGVGRCLANQDARFVKVSSPSRNDTYSRRVTLEPGAQVVITSPVVEGRDAYGPNNDFVVRYVIHRNGLPAIHGAFSFARIFEKSYIQDAGCAIIQNEPTVSFIKQECQ